MRLFHIALRRNYTMQRRNVDINNGSYDLSSFSKNKKRRKRRKNGKANKKKIILTVVCCVLALIIGLGACGWIYVNKILNNVTRDTIDLDLIDINSETDAKFANYTNIALFGLDSRENDDEGRSDAIIILTLDNVHNKIKLTSIARDTLVKIDGHSDQKITHAWMYGKATLALDTINQNFDMNITDYVSMNFYQFADIIDYIGGVWIDVNSSEMKVMNRDYIPYINKMGIKCDKVKKAGYQLLSGGQALAYSRDRYTGSDLERSSRQREVLIAMYDQVKDMSITKLPKLAEMVLSECSTTLSNSQMINMATWVLTKNPTFEQLGLPDESCNAKGTTINTYWVWVYDLTHAAKKIHDFILETGEYAAQNSSSAASSAS